MGSRGQRPASVSPVKRAKRDQCCGDVHGRHGRCTYRAGQPRCGRVCCLEGHVCAMPETKCSAPICSTGATWPAANLCVPDNTCFCVTTVEGTPCCTADACFDADRTRSDECRQGQACVAATGDFAVSVVAAQPRGAVLCAAVGWPLAVVLCAAALRDRGWGVRR